MIFWLYMAIAINTAMITKSHIRYLNRLVAVGSIILMYCHFLHELPAALGMFIKQ
jgi:hypothetical protein